MGQWKIIVKIPQTGLLDGLDNPSTIMMEMANIVLQMLHIMVRMMDVMLHCAYIVMQMLHIVTHTLHISSANMMHQGLIRQFKSTGSRWQGTERHARWQGTERHAGIWTPSQTQIRSARVWDSATWSKSGSIVHKSHEWWGEDGKAGLRSLGAKKNLPDRRHMKTLCNQHLVWATWKFTKLTETNQQIHAKQIQSHERALLGQNHFQLPELFHLFFDSYCKGLTRISGFRRVSCNSGNSGNSQAQQLWFLWSLQRKGQETPENPATGRQSNNLDPFDSKSNWVDLQKIQHRTYPESWSPRSTQDRSLTFWAWTSATWPSDRASRVSSPMCFNMPRISGTWMIGLRKSGKSGMNVGNLGDAVIKTWGNLKISTIFPACPHLAALGNILGTWIRKQKKQNHKTNYRNWTKLTPMIQKFDKTNTYDTEICSTFGLNATVYDWDLWLCRKARSSCRSASISPSLFKANLASRRQNQNKSGKPIAACSHLHNSAIVCWVC